MTRKPTPAQLRVLRAARDDGRVASTQALIGRLVAAGLAERPLYRYGGGSSWAYITPAGRLAAADQDGPQ